MYPYEFAFGSLRDVLGTDGLTYACTTLTQSIDQGPKGLGQWFRGLRAVDLVPQCSIDTKDNQYYNFSFFCEVLYEIALVAV